MKVSITHSRTRKLSLRSVERLTFQCSRCGEETDFVLITDEIRPLKDAHGFTDEKGREYRCLKSLIDKSTK